MTGQSGDILAKLETVKELFKSDKLFQASRLLADIQASIKATRDSDSSSTTDAESARKAADVLKKAPFPRILSECNEVHAFRKSLRSTDGWILSYDGTNTKVWYRRETTTSSHTIRIEGQIRAPLINVAALIYEIDLCEKLLWYVTSACMLPSNDPDTSSVLRRAAHLQLYAPWPLYKRDLAVYGFLTDGLDEDDCIVVVSRSIKETDPVEIPAPSSSRIVRVNMHRSGFELTPLGPGLTKASFLYNVNPHLSLAPMPLINWAARFMCRWSLRILENRARDLAKVSEEHITRLESSPVYDHIRNRLAEYWARKGHTKEDIEAAGNGMMHASSRHSDNFDPDDVPDGPPPSLMRMLLHPRADSSTGKQGRISSYLFGN